MTIHYLKISFRNLWKYKTQSVISIIGLAVGFVCFALSALWIRYEMTYDSFLKDSDRIYAVKTKNIYESSYDTKPELAKELQNTFPEIEEATTVRSSGGYLISKENNQAFVFNTLVDSSYLNIFDVKILSGTSNFLIPALNQIAITQQTAQELFSEENPIGEKVSLFNQEYTVGAIVADCSEHSNFSFQTLSATPVNKERYSQWQTVVKVKQEIDKKKLGKKIENHKIAEDTFELIPITAKRYDNSENFKQVIVLSVVGILVVLCSLLNYLTLFVSRFRMRRKELALRMISGASKNSFFVLFSVDFFASLLLSLLFGIFFLQLICPFFKKISGIPLASSGIFFEIIVYTGFIVLIAFILFGILLFVFQRQTLTVSLRKKENIFRNFLVVFQLIISVVFIFCTVIIIKQIYFIRHADIGFEYKNTAALSIGEVAIEDIESRIKEIPEITEYIIHTTPLIPMVSWGEFSISEWEEQENTTKEKVILQIIDVSDEFLNFYQMKFVTGEAVKEKEKENCILINEAAAKEFGWKNPVGKSLMGFYNRIFTIKGVIKDIYPKSAKQQPKPIMFIYPADNSKYNYFNIRYKKDTWEKVRTKLETMIKTEYPDKNYNLFQTEERYNQMLQFSQEEELIKILTFYSLVCVIVSVFGFFSLVSLTCEERRKEIAIRKVNGGTLQNIISLFFNKYFLLLVIGGVIAFPFGYYIMNSWLQGYGQQTAMSWWIYLLILFGLAMVIILSVGWRVYKTSRENPAETLKVEK